MDINKLNSQADIDVWLTKVWKDIPQNNIKKFKELVRLWNEGEISRKELRDKVINLTQNADIKKGNKDVNINEALNHPGRLRKKTAASKAFSRASAVECIEETLRYPVKSHKRKSATAAYKSRSSPLGESAFESKINKILSEDRELYYLMDDVSGGILCVDFMSKDEAAKRNKALTDKKEIFKWVQV